MIDGLLLLSKNDIPFISAELNIHQPTLKEIGLIGEDAFFTGAQFLTITKEDLLDLSPEDAAKITNFDIFIRLIQDSAPASKFNKICAESLLTIMFPDYKIVFLPSMLAFVQENENHIINRENFDEFQDILKKICCLDALNVEKGQRKYDPANQHASLIVEKIKKGRAKLAQQQSAQHGGQKISILQRYISILSVGEQKDMNSLLEYSVYQLFDEFNRYSLKEQSDFYLEAKMAGAKDLQEVDNWMKDIHSTSE